MQWPQRSTVNKGETFYADLSRNQSCDLELSSLPGAEQETSLQKVKPTVFRASTESALDQNNSYTKKAYIEWHILVSYNIQNKTEHLYVIY